MRLTLSLAWRRVLPEDGFNRVEKATDHDLVDDRVEGGPRLLKCELHRAGPFHSIGGDKGRGVIAASDRPTGGRNEPAKFEWPALLRKLDRIDPSYKQ